ncbi:MAG TPA: AAA family ATPase [Deltaproteobacteria bacterium]|nr:MAG: hypothetical protein A2048_06740 [Deltaproteobacteria bacterium GWA2_45_12]HBF12215.1 AAA family ATPase [Deltaproteobacteria bacterium]
MDRIFPKNLTENLKNSHGLIQVLTGSRQVGKTTAVSRFFDPATTLYASADLPTPPTTDFIVQQWTKAREISSSERTLVLDEVQKIPRWSEVVKKMWDEDKRNQTMLRVCLLGSSAILIEKGLSESLTGRFEMNFFPHWTYEECHKVFRASLEDYVWMGGYPKAYDFAKDPERLDHYLQNSIIEPSLGRDILSLHAVDKPALLRQLFWYVSRLPAHIVSFQKILDHLQGNGNTATLVHYAELLSQAFLVCPIYKYSIQPHRTKKSLPKWLLPNPGLVEASVRREGLKNFTFENLIGSHLLNLLFGKTNWELCYWKEQNDEIDYVITHHNEPILALEVKSGRQKKIPHKLLLKKANLACPFMVIGQEEAHPLMSTQSIDDILNLV